MTTWIFDSECYINYYLAMFLNVETGERVGWERYNDVIYGSPKIPEGTIISFNGNNYDMPILAFMLQGRTNEYLKGISDNIIIGGLKPRQLDAPQLHCDHIDLIEVAPGNCGLKEYGARLNSKKLQDLPFDPAARINDDERPIMIKYCGNDLETTKDLYQYLQPQLTLRDQMSAEFDIDLRSKSDAQIAEAVIKKEVEKATGTRLYPPQMHPDYCFQYRTPSWIKFKTDGMNKVLSLIQACEFKLDYYGSVVMPTLFESLRLVIGNNKYTMGIGGLHSTESCQSHSTDENIRITDVDVTSFYPSIILNEKIYPTHIGPLFLEIYKGIVDRRISAKKAGNNVINEVLKIVINGSFGKLGSKWSVLYAPDLMIQVTLTGQLALLMLIEKLTLNGMDVVSGNTDGLTVKYFRNQRNLFEQLYHEWESETNFNLEEAEYVSLNAKAVNNYIAIKTDGEVKQKGIYSFVGSKKSELEKNPTNKICIDAVINYLKNAIPIEHTVTNCKDVRRFLSARKVTGGAEYEGEFLGKAVRWYYAQDCDKIITYAKNGNKVPRSYGSKPLMTLPDKLPDDIDYNWYITEAKSILKDIGVSQW